MTNGTIEVALIHTVEWAGEVYRHPATLVLPRAVAEELAAQGSVRLPPAQQKMQLELPESKPRGKRGKRR